MALAKQLGRVIANITNQQSQTNDNISPDDPSAQLNAYFTNTIELHSQQRRYRYNYSTTAFILDHPVYGELDSATYALDGGYSNPTSPVLIMASNDNDRYLFHAFNTDLVDTDNTSATVDTVNYQVVF